MVTAAAQTEAHRSRPFRRRRVRATGRLFDTCAQRDLPAFGVNALSRSCSGASARSRRWRQVTLSQELGEIAPEHGDVPTGCWVALLGTPDTVVRRQR